MQQARDDLAPGREARLAEAEAQEPAEALCAVVEPIVSPEPPEGREATDHREREEREGAEEEECGEPRVHGAARLPDCPSLGDSPGRPGFRHFLLSSLSFSFSGRAAAAGGFDGGGFDAAFCGGALGG